MRLLCLSNQRLPTEKAYGRQIFKMCLNLSQISGVDLELVYPHRENQIKESFLEYYGIKEGLKVSRIMAPDFHLPGRLEIVAFSIKSLLSALALARATLSRNPDVIYSRDELPLYILSFFRKNLVFEAHNMQRPRIFMYNRFRKRRVKLVTITKALKDDFIKADFKPENILVAPDGVDADVINKEENSSSDKESARRVLNLPSDKKIVVYAGSLFRWKGVFSFVDAAKLLSDVVFIIVGGDERGDEIELRQYIAANHIENFKITGYIKSEETIRNYIATADVLALPNTAKDRISERYTSPLKLFEYMAARRPIVASNLPSLREVLNEGNSVLVKPDDALALADGIRRILSDDSLALGIAQKAFEDVKKYSWKERAEKILKFIQ